jgi:elongator complex protein 1
VEDVIHPALLESRGQIAEDIIEMKEQIRKQLARLRELRIKKIEEPGERLQFNCIRDTALTNFDRCVLWERG